MTAEERNWGVWFEVPAEQPGCWKWRGFLCIADIKSATFVPLAFTKDEAIQKAAVGRSNYKEASLVEARPLAA